MTYFASYLLVGMVIAAITIRACRPSDMVAGLIVFGATVLCWPFLLIWWAAFESVEGP